MSATQRARRPWLSRLAGIALGAVFVAAAVPKILDPPSFAHEVYNYRLLPGVLVNAAAIALPWIEIVCGLALVLGLWRRAAGTVVAALLVVFVVAVAINLARGHAIDCGCFDVRTSGKTREQLLAGMLWVLLRDGGLLILTIPVFTGSRRMRSPSPEGSAP